MQEPVDHRRLAAMPGWEITVLMDKPKSNAQLTTTKPGGPWITLFLDAEELLALEDAVQMARRALEERDGVTGGGLR